MGDQTTSTMGQQFRWISQRREGEGEGGREGERRERGREKGKERGATEGSTDQFVSHVHEVQELTGTQMDRF